MFLFILKINKDFYGKIFSTKNRDHVPLIMLNFIFLMMRLFQKNK